MIIGYFDYIILGMLLFLNIWFWKEIKGKLFLLAVLVLCGFVLPIISMLIEIGRVDRTTGIIDNFEILYTYLKFPIYWIVGFIQIGIIGLKTIKKTYHDSLMELAFKSSSMNDKNADMK
jgi:hypothetical protein